MKKIKKFMGRIDWFTFLQKACLFVALFVGLMYSANYNSEKHTKMQAKLQAEEQQAKEEKDELEFLREENARLSKVPAEPTARRMEDTGFVLLESQKGLSQDDVVSYSIVENELRLHLEIFAGKIKNEDLLATLDSYIEWLEGLKNRNFEDFLLGERIDDEIDMIIQEKDFFAKEGVTKDKIRVKVFDAMLNYFQECYENGVPFEDAAAQELAPRQN